ncbi:phosphoglycolate phosphatase-like HAD superfamily hydrolase [Streptomyces sp. B3I7]|nr:phosphoglycolate phosphatase-like HAD superfamily hydrolase [Streptomyces sp. B3I7]
MTPETTQSETTQSEPTQSETTRGETTHSEPAHSETTRTGPVTTETENVRQLVTRARFVLWDFDGPICRLFAGHPADVVAREMRDWLGHQGLLHLLTEEEQRAADPHVILRAVDERHPGSDLVTALEELLTHHELLAVPSARPTPYADPVIRTWTAVGARLAVTTNNSARTATAYLTTRGLLGCFAPHMYGRTHELHQLKPDPHHLNRALGALGAAPEDALMIGDSPSDAQAAAHAGVPFLGYARNDDKEKALRTADATTIVAALDQVLEVLRTM